MTYEEAMGGTPPPSGSPAPSAGPNPSPGTPKGISFEEAMGGKPPPPPQDYAPPVSGASPAPQASPAPSAPPSTPETDKSLGMLNQMLGSNPQRIQGQYIKRAAEATTPEENAEFWQKSGEPMGVLGGTHWRPGGEERPAWEQMIFGRDPEHANYVQSQVRGAWNAGAGLSDFVRSPRGIAELGATVASGPLAPWVGGAFLAAEMTPHLGELAKRNYQAITNQLSPTESAQLGWEDFLVALPGAHPMVKKMVPGPTNLPLPSIPRPSGYVPPLSFTRERPGAKISTESERQKSEEGSVSPEVWERLKPDEVPADADALVKTGDLYSYTDAATGEKIYLKRQGGADATEKGNIAEDSADKHTGTGERATVPEDPAKVREEQSKSASRGDSTGAAAEVQVESPYFIDDKSSPGVVLVRSKTDPPDIEIGRYTGPDAMDRATGQLAMLNENHQRAAADAAQAKAEAAKEPAVDYGLGGVPDESARAGGETVPPLLRPLKPKEVKEEKKEEGGQPAELPPELQPASKRLMDYKALKESGQPIPDTAKSLMRDDYNKLQQAGVDMTPYEPVVKPPPKPVPVQESPKQPIPDTPEFHGKPITELLPIKDLAQYEKLEAEWGVLRNKIDLYPGINKLTAPYVDRQIEIRREQRKLLENLPGANTYDTVILGAGTTGLQHAVSSASEGVSVLVLDTSSYGGATNQTLLNNVLSTSAGADSGAAMALNSRLKAMRLGAQFEQIRGVKGDVTPNPDGTWTVRTLGSGPNGEGGKTIIARHLLNAAGVRGRGQPFDITNAEGEIVTKRGVTATKDDKSKAQIRDKALKVIADAREAKEKGSDGVQIFIGAANSGAQGALMAAAAKGTGPVHLIYRHNAPEASDYLRPGIDAAVAEGRLILHPNEQILRVEEPSKANGFKKVAVTEKTLTDKQGNVIKDKDGKPKTELVRIPGDAVGSFLGGTPNTEFMPVEALKDAKGGIIIGADPVSFHADPAKPGRPPNPKTWHGPRLTFQVQRLNKETGQPEPIPGLWAAGSVRSAADNRFPPSAGEGSSAQIRIGDALLKDEKNFPKWKQEVRERFNRQEYGEPAITPRSLLPPEQQVPGAEPKFTQDEFWKPATERWGQKTRVWDKATKQWRDVYLGPDNQPAIEGGKVGKPPPTELKKPREKIGPPPAPLSEQQQQQQGAAEVAAAGARRPRGPGLPAESVEPVKPTAISEKPNYGPKPGEEPGLIQRGNIDYNTRPQRYNDDGTTAQRSVPIETERGSVLVPTIDQAGHPLSVPQAIGRYRDTGEHLGVFNDLGAARDFASKYDPGPVMSRAQVEGAAKLRTAANPYYPDRLVTELGSGQRTRLDPVEEQTLIDRREVLTNARDQAGKLAMNQNIPKGERASAATDFEKADAGIRQMDEATDTGNVIRGRDNKQKWHQFRAKDYDVPAMEQKLGIAKNGEPVTPAEKADLTKKVAKLQRATAAVERAKVHAGWRPGMGKKGDVGHVRRTQHEALKAKEALDETVFRQVLKHKGKAAKAFRLYRNVAGVSRAVMTADLTSALLRQGGPLFFGHPIRTTRLLADAYRAAKSDFNYFKLMQDIRERPNAKLYETSKLGLTDIRNPKMSELEEAYMSAWVDKIPGLSHSQRAYVYFLNRLRADTFDVLADKLSVREGSPVTQHQANGIANFVNVFTGRGHIQPKAAAALAAMNELFFAPRYVISRFQALTGQPFRFAHDAAVSKLIAREYGRTLAGYAVMYLLANTALKQLGVTVEKNPLSSDFGKIKVGNTRIDFLSGAAQTLTFITRGIFAKTKTAQGSIQSLKQGPGIPFTQRNLPGVIFDFFRSKLAPWPAAALNAQAGQKVTGEPTSWGQEALGLVLPLNGVDIYKATVEHGVPAGLALAILANFGASVNTYQTKYKTRTRKQHRHR